MYWFSVIGAVLSLFGNIVLIFKKKSAFIIWSTGNIAWCIYGLWGEYNLPLVLMNTAYIIINMIALFRWTKGEK